MHFFILILHMCIHIQNIFCDLKSYIVPHYIYILSCNLLFSLKIGFEVIRVDTYIELIGLKLPHNIAIYKSTNLMPYK